MHRHVSCLLLLLCAAAVPAQPGPQDNLPREPEGLPQPAREREPGAAPKLLPSPLGDLRREVEQLRLERAAFSTEQRTAAELALPLPAQDPETAQLRLRVGELLLKMGTRRPAEPTSPPVPPKSPQQPTPKELPHKGTEPPPKGGAGHTQETEPHPAPKQAPGGLPVELGANPPVDAVGLGHALFRSGNYDGALKALRQVKLLGAVAEERMPVQYLIATCLRKLGKREEATTLYREVANSRGDEQLALCAQWQLTNLRWHMEVESRLTDLRQRRKALEEKK